MHLLVIESRTILISSSSTHQPTETSVQRVVKSDLHACVVLAMCLQCACNVYFMLNLYALLNNASFSCCALMKASLKRLASIICQHAFRFLPQYQAG